jgi:hypothetical protein
VTNESSIDWRVMPNPWAVPVRHSFNAIGASRLTRGAHVVEPVGEPLAGGFTVAAGSNLSVFAVFTHALFPPRSPHSWVSLDATEFPWFDAGGPLQNPIEDGARYFVRPTAALVVLSGGLRVYGAAPALAPGHSDSNCTSLDYYCLASSSGFEGCEPVGSDVLIARSTVRVPAKRSGVVYFTAKTQVQGDNADPGGLVSLWLTVDGVRRGSTGVQEISAPSGVSQ